MSGEPVYTFCALLSLVALCVAVKEGVFRTVLKEVNTNLDHRPAGRSVPSFMQGLFNYLQENPSSEVFGYSEEDLSSKGPAVKSFRASPLGHGSRRFKFHIPDSTDLQHIAGALLLVRSGDQTVFTRFRRRPLNVSEVSLSEEYLTFNATGPVKTFNHSHTYIEFFISATDVDSDDVYLVVFEQLVLETLHHERRKRDTLMASGRGFVTVAPSEQTSACSFQNLEITFDQVGWYWIIHPPSLEIGMCSGSCSTHNSNINITNNAFLRGLYSLDHEASVGIPPACVPIEYNPAMIMYFSLRYDVYMRRIPQALVSRCGCR